VSKRVGTDSSLEGIDLRSWTISCIALLLGAGMLLLPGCRRDPVAAPAGPPRTGSTQSGGEVVIYISVDQPFSQPIVEDFHDATGIDIRPVYDTEETKTTGMANRLVAEKSNPQADVFWSSEAGRIMVLKQQGVLTPYVSPNAADIPEGFKDPESYWTGFSARARVIIYNTELVEPKDAPTSLTDFADARWRGEFGITRPLFGTSAMEAAALSQVFGEERAHEFYEAWKANDPVVLDGAAVVRDQVANGELPVGECDTDDAYVGVIAGEPIRIVYPDVWDEGTLLIPCTVGLIADGPNPENGRKLIDYLLSTEVESKLAFADCRQMPLRPGVERPEGMPDYTEIKALPVDYERLGEYMEPMAKFLHDLFRL